MVIQRWFTHFCGARRASLALATLAALGWATSAHASTIVNDTWIDGTRTDPASPTYSENGVDSDSDGNIESAWYTSPGAAMSVATNHLSMIQQSGSSSYTSYFTAEGSEVNLANTGDQLKVTWVFTPTSAVTQTNTSQNFRLALVDSPAASRISADGTPGSAAYAGYGMFMNMSIATAANPTANLGNSNPFRLMERDGTNAALLSASTPPWNPLANGATTGNHGYDSGTQYTFVMTLTRNAANGLDIVSTMTGGTLNNTGTATLSFTDPTPNSFKYDTFSLRPSSAATTADTWDTTLFKVEGPASVPEPASLVMVGIASLFCLGRRRA